MTPLAEIVRAEIDAGGPITLARYMALCLQHPRHGYYITRDPLGRDFVTGPEVSQMFGELLGLWAAQVWIGMGRPRRALWVELGPGRGALSADALRAGARVPGFREALEVWFVETSPSLRARQAEAVPEARWSPALEGVPEGPALVLANEFFDALPIRQFARRDGAWRERMVAADGAGLRWTLGPAGGGLPASAPEGAVLERRPAAEGVAEALGARLARHGGAALVVDYGAEAPASGGGDTLQALNGRGFADPLDAPGEADLTAHVDFAALAGALAAGGGAVWPLRTQGALLRSLGLDLRAAALARAAPSRAAEIEGQRRRLAEQMGTLFKALAATGPGQAPPPGFGGSS